MVLAVRVMEVLVVQEVQLVMSTVLVHQEQQESVKMVLLVLL